MRLRVPDVCRTTPTTIRMPGHSGFLRRYLWQIVLFSWDSGFTRCYLTDLDRTFTGNDEITPPESVIAS
ncbi:hypothetical protein [Paenibacillus sp. MBLB4367]|uniref:hypothetical protein n=1 Tax=Paenibacillus sp. MBLB4367 TaxID=3384767 RepID=UPI0039081E37